jgi:hypothetical protein
MNVYKELNDILSTEDITKRIQSLNQLFKKTIDTETITIGIEGEEKIKVTKTPYVLEEDKVFIMQEQIRIIVKKMCIPIIIDMYGIKTYDTSCTTDNFIVLCTLIRSLIGNDLDEKLAGKYFLEE